MFVDSRYYSHTGGTGGLDRDIHLIQITVGDTDMSCKASTVSNGLQDMISRYWCLSQQKVS